MAEPPSAPRDVSALYRATVGPLRRYLARMLRDDTEAEDVAHDAFLRILPEVEADRARSPAALLYTTARRLAINRIKRRAHAPTGRDGLQLDAHVAAQPGVVQQVMARQELARVEAAIAALPAGCRAVLLLRKVELLSHAEISARLGIAVSTIEKQHARALRLLRARLAAEAAAPDLPSTPEGQP